MVDSPVKVSGDVKRYNAEDAKTVDLVLRQFRCLIADLCQQFNGGHPG
jgi:dihydroxyacetone synthase